jgi:hypothetical protein
MACSLRLDNSQGLIFPSSIIPISGNVQVKDKPGTLEILISDKNSNEIFRQSLGSSEPDTIDASFSWDLKSKSNSYVGSGCYTIRLLDTSKEICSVDCKVADTRNILATTRSLKRSPPAGAPARLASIYFEIIEDIQLAILERLEKNRFEEPYFVACITACFIQKIADDLNQPKSRFLDLMTEFQSKNPIADDASQLGLRALFDFLINYMANTEDRVRADAVAKCGQCNLTRNDKAQIVSSLVSAIYPHCRTRTFPENAIGNVVEKISGGMIKLGIKYVSAKHVSRSISMSQTLSLGNPCDVVIK